MGLSSHGAEVNNQESFWHPPVNFFEPHKKTPNSSLKIAALVGDRLFHGLRYEGHLHLITPDTWRGVLDLLTPDFLIVESFVSSCTGHWTYGQIGKNLPSSGIKDVVDYARGKGIPSVYWITHGHEYYSYFSDFAAAFDYVFCADPVFVEFLAADGQKASVLLPAVQPVLHNYISYDSASEEFEFSILVDGFSFITKKNPYPCVFDEIRSYKAKFVDSEKLGGGRFGFAADEYLGAVTPESLVEILKRSRVSLTFDETCETRTNVIWRSLQAAACKSLVLHYGALEEGDIRLGIVQQCANQEQFYAMLASVQVDDLYRERLVQKAWRKVYGEHTFSHRVRDIATAIGLQHDWQEYPLISVVSPTYRGECQDNLLNNYSGQVYPNKELLLILNGPVVVSDNILEAENVRVYHAPAEAFAAACLNLGIEHSLGQYCVRMDDDDYYGEYFLLDLALSLKAVEASVFGKPPAYLLFESDNSVFRRDKIKSGVVLDRQSIADGAKWLAGNSIGGRREFFKLCPYPEDRASAADTGFLKGAASVLEEFFVFDDLNVLAVRRADVSSHTWKLNEDSLKGRCVRLEGVGRSDLFV